MNSSSENSPSGAIRNRISTQVKYYENYKIKIK